MSESMLSEPEFDGLTRLAAETTVAHATRHMALLSAEVETRLMPKPAARKIASFLMVLSVQLSAELQILLFG